MSTLLFVIFVRLFMLILKHGIDLIRRKEGRMLSIFNAEVTLCRSCAYAHIVSGYKGKTKTYCCYSGPVRPIKFAVSECTDYRDKNVPARRSAAGFVPLGDIRSAG